jgi:hypothetical protein
MNIDAGAGIKFFYYCNEKSEFPQKYILLYYKEEDCEF